MSQEGPFFRDMENSLKITLKKYAVLEIGIFVMRQEFSNLPLLIVRGYTVSINRLEIGDINKIFSWKKKDGDALAVVCLPF